MADSVKAAFGNMCEKPIRTALCMISVAVGAASLFLIAAIGVFGRTQLSNMLNTLGVSGFTMYADSSNAGPALSAAVVEEMQEALPQVSYAMPIKAKMGTVFVGSTSRQAAILGVTENLDDVMQLNVLHGALFTARQSDFGERVTVIDNALAMEAFGRENVVGQEIRLRINGMDENFKIAAVIDKQTGSLGGTIGTLVPNLIYVPYGCMAQQTDGVDQVFVQCAAEVDGEQMKSQITSYLNGKKQILGTVRIESISQIIDSVNDIADFITLIFLAIGMIALFVALIGVLCSMLSATNEKTREIGIYLALGARGRDIICIFMWQSILICMLGGLGGTAAAIAVLLVLSGGIIPLSSVVVFGVLAASTACGVIAGIIPAWRAARMCPMEALKQ